MAASAINLLVADDSRVARLIFRDVAAGSRLPINVIEAADGRECVHQLAGGRIDMAFIDIHMPNMSGLEAMWAARELGIRTFVTLMSGAVNEKIIELARKLRPYEFLFKPFGRSEVEQAIRIYQVLSAPLTVLIVDDSATVRKIIQRTLDASVFRISAEEVPDGDAALARCRARSFDLVFLDCNMPGLNGFEVIDRLKQCDPKTRVVMISGQWDDRREREAMARGATAFLRKPFDAARLDVLLHELHDVPSPRIAADGGPGLASQFSIAILGRTISVTHKETGHVYEYLWFPDSPHLRLAQVRQNKEAAKFSRQIRADAELAAILELRQARLLRPAPV
jgi:two-component system, chemotaxis family, chemotaxis protein CheY